MARPPRRYFPIWERLKNRDRVELEVLPGLVARVIKAIKKEKWMDLGFKVINPENKFYLDFSYSAATRRLVVIMKQRLDIEQQLGSKEIEEKVL